MELQLPPRVHGECPYCKLVGVHRCFAGSFVAVEVDPEGEINFRECPIWELAGESMLDNLYEGEVMSTPSPNGRRKTDSIGYKLIMSVASVAISIVISLTSFVFGQLSKAQEEGFKKGIRESKILDNEAQVKVLYKKIETTNKDQSEIKENVHKIDKKVTEISGKLDILIDKGGSR